MKPQKLHHSGCCENDDYDHQSRYLHEDEHDHDHGDDDLKQEIKVVAIVVVLFLIGIIFEERLHNTPFSIAEYAVLIPAYLLSGWSVLTSAGRNILKGRIFDENFLMTIAFAGSITL